MPRVVTIANHKGGVGKTSTSLNLAHAFATDGRTVLLCDLDPQASLTNLLLSGDTPDDAPTLYDLLGPRHTELAVREVIRETPIAGVCLLPAHPDLANLDAELVTRLNRELLLGRVLEGVRDRFDLILLDCPPALNLLTTSALATADEVLIPVEAGYLELQALDAFLATVAAVRAELNPNLRVAGILLTKHRQGSAHDREVLDSLRAVLPDGVLRSVIPYSGRAKESLASRQSALAHDPHSALAVAYRDLAAELTNHHV